MEYTKPALSYPQQADLLLSRGLEGDRERIISALRSVQYYRLAGYFHPFQNPETEQFRPRTSFEDVWTRYVFDRQLKLTVFDAIERIEVCIRSRLANVLAMGFEDPFAYANDPAALPYMNSEARHSFLEEIKKETARSEEDFVLHFRRKYGNEHVFLPVWMAVELMTFGSVRRLYKGMEKGRRKAVAESLGIEDAVLVSWLDTLNAVRNVCAHHDRLWNRTMRMKPKIPKKDSRWSIPIRIDNGALFGVLSICRYALRIIAPTSQWHKRLAELLDKYPSIPLREMGFPEDWKTSPIWRQG